MTGLKMYTYPTLFYFCQSKKYSSKVVVVVVVVVQV